MSLHNTNLDVLHNADADDLYITGSGGRHNADVHGLHNDNPRIHKTNNMELKRKIAFGIFLFLLLSIWSYLQPITNQPDEPNRFLIPCYIMEHGSLPTGETEALRLDIYGISYGYFPMLPYIVMGFFMKGVALFSKAEITLLMAARFVNIIAGIVTYLAVYKLSTLLFRDVKVRWLFTMTAVLWPQVMFIFTYVNCDAFAYMSCAIMVCAVVSGLVNGWCRKNVIWYAVGISICLLSYYNAYCVILGTGITFLLSFIEKNDAKVSEKEPVQKDLEQKYSEQKYSEQKVLVQKDSWSFQWKKMLRISGLLAFIVLVLAGWWFLRSAILYHGDFLGLSANRLSAEKYAIDMYKPSIKATLQNQGLPFSTLLKDSQYMFILKQSFFGQFGIMNILVRNEIIRGYKLILLIGCIGFVLPSGRTQGAISKLDCSRKSGLMVLGREKRIAFYVGMISAFCVAVFLTLWYSYSSDYQPQGRYVLPGLIPLLCLVFIGIEKLTQGISTIRFGNKQAGNTLLGNKLLGNNLLGNKQIGKWITYFAFAVGFLFVTFSAIGCVHIIWNFYRI